MTRKAFPNPLFDQGRGVLARFGYCHGAARDDWGRMWDLLIGDFATRRGRRVPRYDEMSADQQHAAQDYMRRRLIADRNLEMCEYLHHDLFQKGIDTELVERYALAREVYEDSVEDFGRARERLDAMLPE